MGGIAGCLALALEADPDQKWVAAATGRIAHRGPDDQGYFADPDIALGCQRLAVIDLSPGGHQPMPSGDGRYFMVYNGEIYNYLELAQELRAQGVALTSSSDAEVLLETYARVGKDVVHRLRGMFAFAIWDTWTRELFCARDPFGIKPFFYTIDYAIDPERQSAWPGPDGGRHAVPAAPVPAAPVVRAAAPGLASGGRHAAGRPAEPLSTAGPLRPAGPARPAESANVPLAEDDGSGRLLRFASERKALADPGEPRILDGDALAKYLSFQYVPSPQTLTPPIRVLPPGHAMIARPGRSVDVFRYWRPDLRPARAPSDTTAAEILRVMRDSVTVHLRSDVPLGAFLSGGVDSAAICALAAEHRPDLVTFTVGFDRDGYSEIDRAREIAAAIGVKSVPYLVSAEEFMAQLPRIVWHLDDPVADAAGAALWFAAREARKHVTVVLSGEGADELFGGYGVYRQPGLVRAGERLPDWSRFPLKRAAALIPAGVKGKGFLERTSTPLRRRYIGNAHVFIDSQVDVIAGPGVPAGAAVSAYATTDPVYQRAAEADLDDVSTMQLVDITTWLPGDILVKADRMSMAHGLELRMPFLDRDVMAVAARLVRDEKVGGGTTKFALRQAMRDVLPEAVAARATLGFPVPMAYWLKGDMYDFADRLLREAQTDEWINRSAAIGLLERLRAGEPDVSWRHLWVLIVFSLWHQIYLERVYDPIGLGWERPALGLPPVMEQAPVRAVGQHPAGSASRATVHRQRQRQPQRTGRAPEGGTGF
jgi:asparagine synthase (glutamine-hydrolysing)